MADDATPIFDFMLVRPPEQAADALMRRRYIRDELLTGDLGGPADVDLRSPQSPSAIARLVYRKVFCEPQNPSMVEALQDLRQAVLATLPVYVPFCGDGPGPQNGSHPSTHMPKPWGSGGRAPADDGDEPTMMLGTDEPAPDERQVLPLDLADLQRHAYVTVYGRYILLPDRFEDLDAPLIGRLVEVLPLLIEAAAPPPEPGAPPPPGGAPVGQKLSDRLKVLFDGVPVEDVVFASNGAHTEAYAQTKRVLFDALYTLYVLRRVMGCSFESIMDGLQALHALEALAIDEIHARGKANKLSARDRVVLQRLEPAFPALRHWTGGTSVPGFPLAATAADLAEHLAARPVVHLLFARLFHLLRPFNAIKPLGVGDLKVVKQWLVAYQAGEISDIHNMMQGEHKDRVHRRLEKTQELFSYSSSESSETSRDTQSADRFEVKREAEQVLKQDLNVNASLRAQYNYMSVVSVAVGAGFAYNRNSSDQQKVAQNFSREVVDKAVSRVQSSSATQRSTTKIFETEETNTHGFDNKEGDGHVSGIYRWVDKRYRAQVFNYGKRLMFEFVLPEPAALLVQSRLRAYEANLDVPRKPTDPSSQFKTANIGVSRPQDIDKAQFERLRLKYDLGELAYPVMRKSLPLVNMEGKAFFAEQGIHGNDAWYAASHHCKLDAVGYAVERMRFTTRIGFSDQHPDDPRTPQDRNIVRIALDGATMWEQQFATQWVWANNLSLTPPGGPLTLTRDAVDLTLTFSDVSGYELTATADLVLTADELLRWQTQVFKTAEALERKAVDDHNRELKTAYDADMTTYRNRLGQLEATTVHELIQGQSSAYNQDLIMTELRRQCLAMLSKEFDAYADDDLLTSMETMGERTVNVDYQQLVVDESGAQPIAQFKPQTRPVPYPLPNTAAAQVKGRYIQFLEQAFEWNRLGYVCYPYFWATPPKWMELLSRNDEADPEYTAFLRAGAIKVLVAVSPAYDDAVLHFLATREPWEGGPGPVIGDPLYLPLFEELHKAQDDRYGAVPQGEPWEFTLPTSLVYLHGSQTPLPDIAAEQ